MTLEIYEVANIVETGETKTLIAEINTGFKGDKGDKGDTGTSAYEQAVEGGYTGTEEEFNTNLAMIDKLANTSGTNTGDQDISGKEDKANKDQVNGYCSLDGGGKVPLANLPASLLKYQGVWNASTNTPTLVNPDLTKIGYVYNVGTAGTQFGITFSLGDWLIYNASGVPEKSDNSDDVVSVNGRTGTVTGLAEATQLPYFQTKTTLDATLLLGTIYQLSTLTGNISFALPNPVGVTTQEIALIFNLDSNLRTLTITGTNFYPSTLTLVVNLGYIVRFVSDGTKWVVGKRSFIKA